jgi:hypothetical protein
VDYPYKILQINAKNNNRTDSNLEISDVTIGALFIASSKDRMVFARSFSILGTNFKTIQTKS